MTPRIAITGGCGFIGAMLARRLLSEPVTLGGRQLGDVGEVVLVDLVPPPADLESDPRVRTVLGDLEAALSDVGTPEAIFHLAGVVSGAAEKDFDLGMRTNLDGTRALLEHARAQPTPPIVVFSSSLAVFGSDPAIGPVGVVDDDTLPRPQSSYGIQKFIGEQLVADYSRKGFVRGRSVRLMTVAVRPGRPNAAASSFMSGIIREPLAGTRAQCPVPRDMPIALSSPRRTLDGLLCAAAADDVTWGSTTAMNLPALTTTPGDMAAALDRVAGSGTSDLIEWTDDPAVAAIVGSWPARLRTPRAEGMGLHAEATFDDIVGAYVADHGATARDHNEKETTR